MSTTNDCRSGFHCQKCGACSDVCYRCTECGADLARQGGDE